MRIIEIEIHDLSRGGAGVGTDSLSGKKVFVPFAAPGDRIEAEIIKEESRYLTGKIRKILTASRDRIQPKCSVFGQCGGCEWQHLDYGLQWKTKTQGALHALKRVGVVTEGITPDLFPSKKVYNYRNRIQLRGLRDQIGFYAPGSRELVPITRCEIAAEPLNAALDGRPKNQLTEYKWEIQVDPEGRVQSALNARHAAMGFRQVNDEQNQNLKTYLGTHLRFGDDRGLVDLYGGSGNFSEEIWPKYARAAVLDVWIARKDPETRDLRTYIQAPVPEGLNRIRKGRLFSGLTGASAIVDPPRIGIGSDFAEIVGSLRELGVDEILAIGCDADAWARDVARFLKAGYRLERVAFFDFFPQTSHIESVALLYCGKHG